MQRLIVLMLVLVLTFSVKAQDQRISANDNDFINPIFPGDYPDPSILIDGEDYYIVHSSFEYYPGLLIWHSNDLINWTPVANALHKYVGSVWAPDLAKYNGKYYIYFPANNTNYVISANAIEGPWSDPAELKVPMIDPGHVVDNDGNRYLYFSSGSYVPLSKDGLSITGETKHTYDGWKIPRDWSIECFCMEGPKLFKRGDYYYLTVAEGGTAGPATSHMVISARSKSPLGPWENSPYNPILRAQSSEDKWCSIGHGTVFEDASGKWWMIFHGYEKEHYNMGRQTLMLPIEWSMDGWYKIRENVKVDKPIEKTSSKQAEKEFSLSDNFGGTALKLTWKFFGEYDTSRYQVNNNSITINGKGKSIPECSPMLCIPSDHSYMAQVELELEGDAIGGLVLFYNQQAYSGILADKNNILTNLRGWQFATEKNVNHTVDMFYSIDGENWIKTENSLEVSGYHHNVLGGFLSLRIGLCSIGEGKVIFKNFVYQPI
jgi:xylan 1,4-beta-xylosidase